MYKLFVTQFLVSIHFLHPLCPLTNLRKWFIYYNIGKCTILLYFYIKYIRVPKMTSFMANGTWCL